MIRTGVDLLDKKGEVKDGSLTAITGLRGSGAKSIFIKSIMESLYQDRSVIVISNELTLNELAYRLVSSYLGTDDINDDDVNNFLNKYSKMISITIVNSCVKDSFVETMYRLVRESPSTKDIFVDNALFCNEYEGIRYLAQYKGLRIFFNCTLPRSEDGIELRVQKILSQTGCMQFLNILYVKKDIVNRAIAMKFLKNNFDNDYSVRMCHNFDLATSSFGGFY